MTDMKKITLLAIISTFSLALSAQQKNKPRGHAPKVYIMMRHGKLIEVNNGHRKLVRKDVTLVNQTTIHPNGSIDASNGQNLQLKEGEYSTMTGRIRNLKDMPRPNPGK